MSYFGPAGAAPAGSAFAFPKELVEAVTDAPDPVAEAEALLAAIREVKISGNIDALDRNPRWTALRQNWAPDSIEKLAAWVAILVALLTFLRSAPDTKIEINNAFQLQCERVMENPKRFGVEDLIPPHVRRL